MTLRICSHSSSERWVRLRWCPICLAPGTGWGSTGWGATSTDITQGGWHYKGASKSSRVPSVDQTWQLGRFYPHTFIFYFNVNSTSEHQVPVECVHHNHNVTTTLSQPHSDTTTQWLYHLLFHDGLTLSAQHWSLVILHTMAVTHTHQ